ERATPAPPVPVIALEGASVILVGYFSAKEKDWAARMHRAAATLTGRSARVVGHVVQRRGVSAGGVRKMALPLSPLTLVGSGKAREIALLRARTGADAVVFLNELTPRRRAALAELTGCPVVSLADGWAG
uniref:HflX-like GTP-binding protein n=1 Tax=Streptomyces sp. SBT349 TaxID=1580539 RepID=UPI000ACAB3E2